MPTPTNSRPPTRSRRTRPRLRPRALAFLGASLALPCLRAEQAEFLSDHPASPWLRHQQEWGEFGRDTAAARPGTAGSPLRIGQETFAKGLGHHANGEIVIDLDAGHYTAFRACVGVQWQGGQKGSVIFRIRADERTVFETGPMSDSDPARQVEVPLAGVRELRLIAGDAGDGIACDMANWAEARLACDPHTPRFGPATLAFDGVPAPPPSDSACGFALVACETGPQVAVMPAARSLTASVDRGEEVRCSIPIANLTEPLQITVEIAVTGDAPAEVELVTGTTSIVRRLAGNSSATLLSAPLTPGDAAEIALVARGVDGEAGVRWGELRWLRTDQTAGIPLAFPPPPATLPPPALPSYRPAIEQELIEWDWRMQDGIGTAREPRTWTQAIALILERGDRLIEHLAAASTLPAEHSAQWEVARRQYHELSATDAATESEWERLWRDLHGLRRAIALGNPLARTGPILFVKRVPSSFSHQLTQYSGRCARPGGGVFVLDAPGFSMQCRQLAATLPTGSYLHPEVAWDGTRVLFAFCQTDPLATDWRANTSQFYHLFEMAADGAEPRQLTDGPYDDFAPRCLPDGKILFLSTRRGGFHRCGQGPCPVHTLALANVDGSQPRVISFHETHEWDPAVLNDGRIIYTRWDYVDRHAVHYQQLWSARPDGSNVQAFYGNNTLNPVGVWEARPVPGSNRVMATAGAHHAMTAGSIILLDVTRGIDGLAPITRLTKDALFPESEFPVGPWHAPAGVTAPPAVPPEERRWPGHCYRTPCPLSESFFLAAYSFDPLIGEPQANRPNMFGLYLVDRFGNKELLYRDLNIGSVWPAPLRARPIPPAVPSTLAETEPGEGTFLLHDVYASWPQLNVSRGTIRRLRIVQVLPKTTPNANTPRVGLANASPGKQVLGTVAVEPDGSAYFRAPSGIPLAFQALDERGMAVQTMRSLTYLQPGEQTSCVGCHEDRATAPLPGRAPQAAQRAPSAIEPAPEGSRPLSYPILVQPVLDRHCAECHSASEPKAGIDLTGAPAGEFTASYNALAPRVPYSEWKGTPQANAEPLTRPDLFGARASPLMSMLLKGHNEVSLSGVEIERLVTWMDANALFYGTFDPGDQERQRRGERIAGPALE